jgi:hypothetical protein
MLQETGNHSSYSSQTDMMTARELSRVAKYGESSTGFNGEMERP